MTDGQVPQTEEEPLPDQYLPPEVRLYRPQGANVVKPGDGSTQLEFMISPLLVIGVIVPEDAARELAAQINGGVVVAKSVPLAEVPRGRRPQ